MSATTTTTTTGFCSRWSPLCIVTAPRPSLSPPLHGPSGRLNAALSYAAYSLSNTMSHDNVVPEEEMRAHMAKASPLRHVTNQFHYYSPLPAARPQNHLHAEWCFTRFSRIRDFHHELSRV